MWCYECEREETVDDGRDSCEHFEDRFEYTADCVWGVLAEENG